MASIDDVYVLLSTVAAAHDTPVTKNVNAKEFESILNPPLTIGESLAGTMISSQRDQIEVIVAATKTNVRDLSGGKSFASSNVGKVMEFFKNYFNLNINSYGINYNLRVPCPDSKKWIIANILSPVISETTGKVLVGGAGAVSLEAGAKTWNIKFEPTDDNKINIDFNASEITHVLPDANSLREELQEQWDLLVEFLQGLNLVDN